MKYGAMCESRDHNGCTASSPDPALQHQLQQLQKQKTEALMFAAGTGNAEGLQAGWVFAFSRRI